MKKLIITVLLASAAYGGYAQKYMTRTGKITFFSATPMENIEAFNNEAACVIDSKTGDFVIQAPIKSFKFEKQLMQDHFNEDYMESNKYPKSEYKGKITDISSVNWSKDGSYNVHTTGKLTMHNVTRDVTLPAIIVVKGKTATITSKFKVIPQDYKIEIPKLVEGKIAKQIEVTVSGVLDQK